MFGYILPIYFVILYNTMGMSHLKFISACLLIILCGCFAGGPPPPNFVLLFCFMYSAYHKLPDVTDITKWQNFKSSKLFVLSHSLCLSLHTSIKIFVFKHLELCSSITFKKQKWSFWAVWNARSSLWFLSVLLDDIHY
jgi:hypothetical protein